MRAVGEVRFSLPRERSRSSPRKAAPATRTATPGLESLDAASRLRFEKLRAHRAQIARSRGVPAYVVALDRTLVEMAARSPDSRAALLDVFGMGPARVEAYGDGFLDVLRSA